MLISFPLLLLCFSFTHAWDVKSQTENKQTPEDIHHDVTHEAAKEEKIVKTSVLPFKQVGSKTITKTISSLPGGGTRVNTTIRLKFSKDDSEDASKGIKTGKPITYNFKQDELNSKEHTARSRSQGMSSRKIIVYNQTDTQKVASDSSQPNQLLLQFQNLHWPAEQGNQEVKGYSLHEEIRGDVKRIQPIGQVKVITESQTSSVDRDVDSSGHQRNEQRKMLEALKIIMEEQNKTPAFTKSSHKGSYNVSDDQVRLLQLLHKLIENRDISYEFLNRLVLIFYKNGYRDDLLKVLFEIIVEYIDDYSVSKEQHKLIQILIDLWKSIHKVQMDNQGASTDKYSPNKLSNEEIKALQLLKMIISVKESNAENQNALRLGYVKELNGIYDSSNNKDNLMKVIFDFYQKNQAAHEVAPDSDWQKQLHLTEDFKKFDINDLLNHILQQKDTTTKDTLVVEDFRNPDELKNERWNVLFDNVNQNKVTTKIPKSQLSEDLKKIVINDFKPTNELRNEGWNALLDNTNKNKVTTKNPYGILIGQDIYEEIETEENPVTITPSYDSQIWKYSKQKTPITDTTVSEKARINKVYEILLNLLSDTEVSNKPDLQVKIAEILKRMKSHKIDTSNDSGSDEDDEGGLVDDSWGHIQIHEKHESEIVDCISGSTWTVSCQTCVCVRARPICKKLKECSVRQPDEPMQCKPYSTFKLDKCNNCKCNTEGIPICTFKECKQMDKDTTAWGQRPLWPQVCPPEKKWPVCAPNTNWRSGCHDCVCDEHGQRRCQKVKNCQLLPFGEESNCQPNTVFRKGCKKCKCTNEGRLMCINIC